MAQTITIVDEVLTYQKDSESTIILSKWVCDKHHDIVLIGNAYGAKPIELGKISSDNPVTVDSTEYTDPALAREAIGVNW